MLDIKFIRENPDIIKDAVRKKNIKFNVDELLSYDAERLQLLSEVEDRRSRQNRMNNDIAAATGQTRDEIIDQMKILKEGLRKKEEELKVVITKWQMLMVSVPNVPDISVPEGKTEDDNQEIKTVGEKTVFDFEPKSHVDLMSALSLADFERGVKVAGFRGYFLKNEAVSLSFAIWQYATSEMIKNGFTPLLAPSLVSRAPFLGSGHLPQGEDDLYKTQDGDFLSGTAEVPVTAYFADEVLELDALPIKFVAFSPCFRREAGSHGKDTKGLIRVHEFYKVEQVILAKADHAESVRLHEEITANSENLLKNLKLPYRVVANCGGDLGLKHVKQYDIETWMPSENKYRETHSSSYFHDFQTRRLNIRYKDSEGKLRFAYSLNNTALATPRILAAIIENYQQADGSVVIPEVLRPFVGKEVIAR